jgi:Putative beta-barrel porin-2, OmpL-like. bbp2
MKFNKLTMGLAAVGVVSLASAARADETPMSQVQTALSSTTISGYVDTSMQWNPGSGNTYVAPVAFQNSTKADGFNLNVVDLALDKPMDESPWAAGYHVELWMGPDANTLATLSNPYLNPTTGGAGYPFPGPKYYGGTPGGSDFALRQAYVALRTPIASTSIDWKVGVFDSPLGYESTSSPLNPTYTHSYGYTIEPTELTGVMGTYKANDIISVSAGIADVAGPMINQRAFISYGNTDGTDYYNYPVKAESYKTYFGAITLTAPDNWSWLKGATLTGGVLNGYSTSAAPYGGTQTSWYAGITVPTPLDALRFGAAFDYLNVGNTSDGSAFDGDHNYYTWAGALYANYQFNDKLSFAGRYDYWNAQGPLGETFDSLTADVQYKMWANVITRLEARWDHAEHGTWFGGTVPFYNGNPYEGTYESYYDGSAKGRENAFMLALNVIYQF